MIRNMVLAAGLLLASVPCAAASGVDAASFDVLGSMMETRRAQINSADILESNKEEAIRYREKVIAGWWEFMQARSGARPGEYCAASFLRGKRVKRERVDGISDGVVVTLFGPGGGYRGALLGFSPLTQEHAFPRLGNGTPVRVTLRQGNLQPATLNAIYAQTSATAPPMLLFAVPSIEALLAGMEDDWHFEVIYQGVSIADIAWHDGLKARDALKRCLAGAGDGGRPGTRRP